MGALVLIEFQILQSKPEIQKINVLVMLNKMYRLVGWNTTLILE